MGMVLWTLLADDIQERLSLNRYYLPNDSAGSRIFTVTPRSSMRKMDGLPAKMVVAKDLVASGRRQDGNFVLRRSPGNWEVTSTA